MTIDNLEKMYGMSKTLSPNHLLSLKTIYKVIGHLIPDSFELFELDFCKKVDIGIRISVWSRIALTWGTYLGGKSRDFIEKYQRDVFDILLLTSMGGELENILKDNEIKLPKNKAKDLVSLYNNIHKVKKGRFKYGK